MGLFAGPALSTETDNIVTVSHYWIESQDAHPEGAKEGSAYFNTEDDCAYVLVDGVWVKMAGAEEQDEMLKICAYCDATYRGDQCPGCHARVVK